MKALGDVDRILTGHRVDDEKRLVRLYRVAHAFELAHELVVDVQTTGGVDQHRVVTVVARLLACLARDVDRIGLGLGRIDRHVDLLGQLRQLFDCGRTVDVGRHQIRLATELRAQMQGELGGCRGLTGTVQTHQHHDHRRRRRQVELGGRPTHELGELLIDDLDEVLLGSQAGEHFAAQRLAAHLVGEIANHVDVDVGLEQRQTHLADRVLDVLFGDLAVPAQTFDRQFELVG